MFAMDSEFESEFEIDRVTVSRDLHCITTSMYDMPV